MSRLDQVIARLPVGTAKAVFRLRDIHSCLMELDRETILAIQTRSVYLNYTAGEGRFLDSVPHYYDRPDGKGGSVRVETYYRYINKVH